MAWVKLDDHMDEHPKLAKVGPLGFALAVHGLLYCGRNLTDGFIPYSVAIGMVSWEYFDPDGQLVAVSTGTPERFGKIAGFGAVQDVTVHYVIGLLTRAGIWKEAPGGYQIHDYLEYQPSREEVLKDRVAYRNQRVAAGIARASQAVREAGKFAAHQLNTSEPARPPADTPAGLPADDQRLTSPVPVPVLKIKEGPAAPAEANREGIGQELTTSILDMAVRSRTRHPMREPAGE